MSDLYREEAVKKGRSAKRLDSDIRVVSVRMWITLVISLAFVITLIIWGIMGRVPITEDVMGVYISSIGNMDIRADRSGTIETVPQVATLYDKGDVLATFKGGARLYSPSFCDVSKIYVNPGEWVQEGDLLFSCTRQSRKNPAGIERAYLYIPYDENDKFDYNLPVTLDAVGVSEDTSCMQGLIATRNKNVVSEEQIKKKFGMEEISEAFADGKPKIEVLCVPKDPGEVDEKDRSFVSDEEISQIRNLGWTSALTKGMEDTEDPSNYCFVPDMTIVKATVTLEYRRPITLLIPALEKVFKPISSAYDYDEIDWDRDLEPTD